MAYYGDVSLISAWCELRQDFRSFRVDRILSSQLLDEHFSPEQGRLTAAWHALSKEAPGGPSAGSKVAKGASVRARASPNGWLNRVESRCDAVALGRTYL
jgi:predicted DNA-binding transcriptional regulator YafY